MINYGSPFNNLLDIQRAFEDVFDAPVFGNSITTRGAYPSVNLFEDKEGSNLLVLAELPGMEKDKIGIDFQNETLTISGEIDKKEKEGAHRLERKSGKFSRSIKLPHRVDAEKVNARYEDGVLAITLVKAEEAKPRKISVA